MFGSQDDSRKEISEMIFAFIVPFAFLAIGLFCLTRANFVANWLKSFSRPIRGHEGRSLINQQVQEKQATSRPIFIQILGIIFSGVGIWALINVAVSYFE
jgi:hypothetical protein